MLPTKYFDLHCDTAGLAFQKGVQLSKNNLAVDFERMSSFSSPGAFFAVWVTKDEQLKPLDYVKDVVGYLREQIRISGQVKLVTDLGKLGLRGESLGVERLERERLEVERLERVSGNGDKPVVLISVEGGDVLEGEIDNVHVLRELGVSLLTLTWNGRNEIGCGAYCDEKTGLSEFGKRVVRRLEDEGIIIDVSHLNEMGFDDVCGVATLPFIASHSNAVELCGNSRNLRDWQIKEISARGGVIGVNIYSVFLIDGSARASVEDVIRHMDYIMKIAKSDDCIAVGTDFDGMKLPIEKMDDITGMEYLNDKIAGAFGEKTACKIMWENVDSFFKKYYNRVKCRVKGM